MDRETIAGLVKGGVDAANGLINQAFYKRNLRLQTEAQKDIMGFEHELNVEDWNMQNEYNLPQNQYQRYIDAGMSPAAAMQAVSGMDTNATMAGTTSGSVPAPSGGFGIDVAGTMLDARRVQAENDLKAAQADFYKSETEKNVTLLPEQVQNIKADTLEKFSEIKNNDAATKKFDAETERIVKLTDVEREKIVKETNLLVQKILETKEAIKNLGEQRNLMQSEEAKNYAEANLAATTEQGQVYKNYSSMVGAMKDDVQRFLIESYHINPDDEFWKQIIESASKGEQYGVSFLQALGDFAQGVDSEMTKHFPHYKQVAAAGAAVHVLRSAWDDAKGDTKDAIGLALKILSVFPPTSAVAPIGFIK